MVSTRSALKRPNDDEDSPTSSKRARTERDQPRSMMDLPAEVRSLILKELLSLDTPIEYHLPMYLPNSTWAQGLPDGVKKLWQTTPPANGLLYPQILRTCKRLYLEGSPILYNNTINCRVGQTYLKPDRGRQNTLYVMGRPFNTKYMNVPPAVRSKMSRIHIQLFAHHQNRKRFDSSENMAWGIRKLTVAMRSVPAWKHIEIEVLHVYKSNVVQHQPRKPADNVPFEQALNPCRYIRNRSSVRISGIEGTLISALRALMVSTEPFADLDLALGCLKNYMDRVVAREFSTNCSEGMISAGNVHNVFSEICSRGARREDSEMFIRGRRLVMSLLNDRILSNQNHVFHHDPASWNVGPTLAVLDQSNKSHEPMDEETPPLSEDGDEFEDEIDDESADESEDEDCDQSSTAYASSDDDRELDDDDEDSSDDDWNANEWENECGCGDWRPDTTYSQLPSFF